MKKMIRFILGILITEDEEARAYNVTRSVKTVQGLNFRVEDDRPIEKIAGVYRPIDLDSEPDRPIVCVNISRVF